MSNKNENIDFWIGRMLIFFFFLSVLSFSHSPSNHSIDADTISIEQLIDMNNSATLVEPVGIPNYDNSLIDHKLCALQFRNTKLNLWVSNRIIIEKCKVEELRFNQLKPGLLTLQLHYLKSFSPEDDHLIS